MQIHLNRDAEILVVMFVLSLILGVRSCHALATGRAALPDQCPAGVTSVSIQPLEVIVYRPTYLSVYITTNTVLVFDDVHTISVSEAPILLVTEIGRFETSSEVHSRSENPSLLREGFPLRQFH